MNQPDVPYILMEEYIKDRKTQAGMYGEMQPVFEQMVDDVLLLIKQYKEYRDKQEKI